MKPLKKLIYFLGCGMALSTANAELLLDTVADFSVLGQGTNGIYYGYFTTADSTTGTFSTDGMAVTAVPDWRGTEAFGTPLFSATLQHPGANTLFPAVRAYIIGDGDELDFTGTVNISGHFGGPAAGGGGGVVGFVTLNNQVLFSAPASGSVVAEFNFLTTVAPGDSIYFGVAPSGGVSYDTTSVAATITTVVPEPATASWLCGMAALSLVVFRRRSVAQGRRF